MKQLQQKCLFRCLIFIYWAFGSHPYVLYSLRSYTELYKRVQGQINQECKNFDIKKIGYLRTSFVGHCLFPM